LKKYHEALEDDFMRNKRTKSGLASLEDIEFVIENMNLNDYD